MLGGKKMSNFPAPDLPGNERQSRRLPCQLDLTMGGLIEEFRCGAQQMVMEDFLFEVPLAWRTVNFSDIHDRRMADGCERMPNA